MTKLTIVAILAGLFLVGSLLIPGGSSVNVKKLYEEAEKAFQENKYQEAITKYQEAMEEGKKWGADTAVIDEDFESNAKFKIAVCYSRLGEQLDDPAMYEKSLELVPEIYENAKVSKVKEGVIFLWGHNYFELEQYEEAEPKFRELLNDYPDSQFAEKAYYYLGNLYYELKQYESSRESFKKILDQFPNSTLIEDSQYFIARCFYDEENYDQAHIEFEKVKGTDKPALLAQSRYYNGLSLLRVGRNQDALAAYQRFIADFPDSVFIPAAYFDMGTIHGKLKEYDEATRNYELAIQSTKDEVTKGEIQYQIGNNYYDQEDFQSAVTAYTKLMEGYPESVHIPESRFMIAESYWGLKDYQNAIATYTEVLEKDPEGNRIVESTFKMAECYYQMGDKEMALEWYQKVIDNYPESPAVKDATFGKLWSLNDLERYDEAEQVGRAYINKYKADPVYDIAAAEAQMMLGDMKFDAENYVEASDEYLRVSSDYSDLPKFDPYKSRSLLQAGYAYYKESERNNWDTDLLAKAASAFDKLLTQYETNFDKEKREFESRIEYVTPAIVNLGLSYSKMGETDKAIKALDIMPKSSPEYGRAMFLKGEVYKDAGDVDKSVQVYRELVANKTISESWRSRAAIEMASMLRDAGRHAEAVVEYEKIIQEYPKSEFVSTAMYFVGSSYYDMEPKTPDNMNKAVEAFRRVLNTYPDSEVAPWSYLGIVMAYEAAGAYDMVIKTADEIENQYQDSKLKDAKKVIDMARRQKVDAMSKLETGVSTDILIAELRKVADDPVGEESGKISALMRIGTLLFNDGKYADSIKEYEALLQRHPEGEHKAAAYYQIAAGSYWTEDYPKAIASAQKGLMDPNLTQDLATGLNYTLGLAYNKAGETDNSIAALKKAIEVGGSSDKQQTLDIVFASHRELARVYGTAKQYENAVTEYKFLAENSEKDSEKVDAYFWLARTYEDNINDYQTAAQYYEQVLALSPSDIMTAQSLYYLGVVYSKHLKNDDKALSTFQKLVSDYSSHEDSNIQIMVTDASLRIPELLVKLGKFDDAVKLARDVRDKALAGTDQMEKINTQYQLAFLLGEQAGKAADAGTPNPDLAREAAVEYGKVYEAAKPIDKMSDETKTLASASLYNAGYLLYGLGKYEDYVNALKYFDLFTTNFPKNDNYSAALEYLGFASFEAARLSADLDAFVRTAKYFLRFSKEFPKHKDASLAQFQAAEAYFAVGGGHTGKADEITDPNGKAKEVALAVEAYKNAIAAYRGLVDRFPNSEYAPESLYAMAASYSYLAEASADNAAKAKASNDMGATYKELSEKYPQSEHAAAAFLSVGNDYYNKASEEGLSNDERTKYYRLSLDAYRKALQVPSIETKVRMSVEAYVRETEELLAKDTYNAGYVLVPYEGEMNLKAANAPKAIPYFKEVIKTMPNTDYADLSYVQLGLCYEYLEDWENSEKAYGGLIQKYTDASGNPIAPFSENVVEALRFAKDRKAKIMAYRISLKASQ